MPAKKFDYTKADAFGGVVIDHDGRVLLREPADHYGGYVWTFAKGRPRPTEWPEKTALRAVREETGVRAAIRALIPKSFKGATGGTVFFLMRSMDEVELPSDETRSVRWAEQDEARRLISCTTFEVGRDRDLAVLEAAFAMFRSGEQEADDSKELFRSARRIMDMTAVLHRRGFQKLRIMPYEYPIAYRIGVLPRKLLSIHNGAWAPDVFGWEQCINTHANGARVFGWLDASLDTPEQLADKFERRFSEAIDAGAGRDWEYAGWLVELLGFVERTGKLPAAASENFPFQPYSAPGLPFVDYANGASFEIGMPLPPPGELVDEHEAFSGGQSNSLLDAINLVSGPGYLGSPSVVSDLIGRVIKATIRQTSSEISYEEWLKEVASVTAAFSEDSAVYTRMPGWHSADQLGAALVKYMELDADYNAGESLYHIVSEGLTALSLAIRKMLKGFNADPIAVWNPHALEQLNALHSFATTVFLGTNTLVHSEKMLGDFHWVEVA